MDNERGLLQTRDVDNEMLRFDTVRRNDELLKVFDAPGGRAVPYYTAEEEETRALDSVDVDSSLLLHC